MIQCLSSACHPAATSVLPLPCFFRLASVESTLSPKHGIRLRQRTSDPVHEQREGAIQREPSLSRGGRQSSERSITLQGASRFHSRGMLCLQSWYGYRKCNAWSHDVRCQMLFTPRWNVHDDVHPRFSKDLD